MFCISNTTLSRDRLTDTKFAAEVGGLSGSPLFFRSTQMLANVYRLTNGGIPLIGVGGIRSGETALAKIEAGASLVQLYTALVFSGPQLVEQIKEYLLAEIKRLGCHGIQDLVGTKSKEWASGSVNAFAN